MSDHPNGVYCNKARKLEPCTWPNCACTGLVSALGSDGFYRDTATGRVTGSGPRQKDQTSE